MNQDLSATKLIYRMWWKLSKHRRMQFGGLLVLMILTSFSEALSIAAIFPFLAALSNPESIYHASFIQFLISLLNITQPTQLIFPLAILFGAASFFVGVMRLLMLWVSTRVVFAAGADLSIDIYRRTLYQAYEVHCRRNSSEVISGIVSKTNTVIYSVILPTLTLITSSFILVAILIALCLIQPEITLYAFGGFGLIYLLISLITRNQLLADSKIIAANTTLAIKSLQEGLGGIRDVLIDGGQEGYCKEYQNADSLLRRAQGNTVFIGQVPRYAVESLGMIMISLLAATLSGGGDGMDQIIPILGALALGAQRLLPVLQQGYLSITAIVGSQASLQDALEFLDQPLPDNASEQVSAPIPFQKFISLRQISFRYEPDAPWVFKNLNLNIAKGSRIGLIGSTGVGKSTLVDIIIGLLYPVSGEVKVDGVSVTPINCRSWQAHISHVPQSIFLADSSVEENIAFGIPRDQINFERVRWAAEQADIAQTIESWSMQYKTSVGERGVRLSGGQRQRIGIARALYKNADVLIFDEATSALDGETESSIIKTIENLGKDLTILIVAHRITTLKCCSQILELGDEGVRRVVSYHELLKDVT